MYADAQSELTVGSVADLEDGHLAQQIERHFADLDNMAALVWSRYSADYHVRIPYRLDLGN